MFNKTILVVDDEEITRKAFVDALSTAGFSVIQACDGLEGLETAKTKHPDLILLDNAMPKMTGMEMMRNLRKDAWGKGVAIFIITAFDANDEIMKYIVENEPTYYLMKGKVNIDEILQKIKEKLEA